jgi:hypothetical protein
MGGDPIQVFRRTFPEVADALDRQQWTLQLGGSGHVKVRDDKNRLVASMAASPGDTRSWKNTVADLKRAGLDTTPVLRKRYLAAGVTISGTDPLDLQNPLMNYEQIKTVLDLDDKQVLDAKKNGLLGEGRYVPGSRGLWFLTDDVKAFRDAGYRDLYPKRRNYTKNVVRRPDPTPIAERPNRQGAEPADDLCTCPLATNKYDENCTCSRPFVQSAIPDVTTLRMTRPELLEIVRGAVLSALREYHRDR